MSFLVTLWERISWKLWGRRLAFRQVRKLIEQTKIVRDEAPYYSVEVTHSDDANLN